MKVVEIKDVTKVYDETEVEVHAVNGISLDFDEGEFAAIVGPSGSGKTTLLNMLGGLDNSTSGEIIVNNVSISELFNQIQWKKKKYHKAIETMMKITIVPKVLQFIITLPKRIKRSKAERKIVDFRLNNIGFVFQSYNLIPVLTASENVEFIMHLQGVEKNKRDQRVKELLDAVGLGDRLDSRPKQLSGGQQQRVAVARALASKPKFILADEPTANLDSKSTENLLEIMEKLNKEENITFIFSTHDARVVKKAHRVITIEDGKVVSDERK
ncbi:MAG: ABC transporter ATP-binding protein [Bacteroidales bacterium]|nr:ABC transporter ATP-binding protein [Bacteroidales bacterium]